MHLLQVQPVTIDRIHTLLSNGVEEEYSLLWLLNVKIRALTIMWWQLRSGDQHFCLGFAVTSCRFFCVPLRARTGTILQRNSPAGVSTFARSRRASLLVSRNTRQDTVRANIDNFAVRVLGRWAKNQITTFKMLTRLQHRSSNTMLVIETGECKNCTLVWA